MISVPTLNNEKLAKQICEAMRMGRKPNPGIALAEKAFGKALVKKVLGRKEFGLDDFPAGERKKIIGMSDIRYGPLVYKAPSGRYKAKPEVGEVLSLSYVDADERCKRLAIAVRNECWRRGVHVMMKHGNDADSRLYYGMVPEDTITELPSAALARALTIDASISIGDKQDREWKKGLEKRLLLEAPANQKLFDILDKRATRWCGTGFPVKMNRRKDYLVPPATYERIYVASIMETYAGSIQKLCRYYHDAFEGGDKVHITARDGTDLTFSIKGRPALVADGIIDEGDIKRGDVGLNIPDGEMFLAPLEHTANGRIFFDWVNISGFGSIKGGLWITFRDGKVVKYEAGYKEGNAIFRKFLDSNTGEKDRIAELGIGTNPAARFIGTIIVDEKIYGTIHIAIGNNTGAYHGKNRASSHLDMIKQMKGRAGNVTVDGKLVMKNGEPTRKL